MDGKVLREKHFVRNMLGSLTRLKVTFKYFKIKAVFFKIKVVLFLIISRIYSQVRSFCLTLIHIKVIVLCFVYVHQFIQVGELFNFYRSVVRTSFHSSIDVLHKLRLNLTNITLYIMAESRYVSRQRIFWHECEACEELRYSKRLQSKVIMKD